MAFGLEQLAQERRAEIDAAVRQAKQTDSESQAQSVLIKAIGSVRDQLSSVVVDKIQSGDISVNNLDEVKASLRNELRKLGNVVLGGLKELKVGQDAIDQIRAEMEERNTNALESNYDIQVVKRAESRIRVDNLDEVRFPSRMDVGNLAELERYFKELGQTFSKLKLDVRAPQVDVNVPELKMPEIVIPPINVPDISVPAPDLSDLTKTIKSLKDVLRKKLADTNKQVQAFSGQSLGGSEMKKIMKTTQRVSSGTSGAKALSDAASAVQVSASSTAMQYVDLSCTGGIVAVGDSSAQVTTSQGVQLYPGNLPYRVSLDNLNKLYAAGAAGTRLCYVYYV